MYRFVQYASVAAVLVTGVVATAADRVWKPYREVCEKLGMIRFYQTPEPQRDHLRLLYKLPADDPGLRSLVLTIDSKTHAVAVVPDSSGSIEIPYDEQLLAENPNILVNLPAEKKAAFEVDLRPRLPTALELSYTQLMGGVPQANALIKKEAGLLSVFVPTVHSVVLQFEHADGQQVSFATGGTLKQIVVDARAQIVIPYEEALAAANPRVILSALPRNADFE